MEHVQDSQQSASGVRMREVLFDSGGVLCAADLYLPGKTGPVPCVVMGHGGSGTKRLGLPAYAEKFPAGGLAAFVFDYRGFGASEGEPRQVIDVDAQREDYLAAVGYIRTLAEIDPQRIAVWGTSLSGGYVLAVAAADPAIAAVVSQVPMIDGMHRGRTLRQRLNWEVTGRTLQFTVAAVRDLLRARRGQPPYYVPVVAPPGQLAVFTEPEARATFEALGSEACGWRNELAPRFRLRPPQVRGGYRRTSVDAAAHVPGRSRPAGIKHVRRPHRRPSAVRRHPPLPARPLRRLLGTCLRSDQRCTARVPACPPVSRQPARRDRRSRLARSARRWVNRSAVRCRRPDHGNVGGGSAVPVLPP